jgi:hypothetical protein
MHYCQACDDPHLMVPRPGVAQCPVCGNADPVAATRPLFVVTGASGSGKTTLLPLLLDRLAGRCVVFDTDWLIDPLSRAAPDGRYDVLDAWLHVAHGVAQNGLDTLLLGPWFPPQLDGKPGRAWIGGTHYLVLDCPDDERRRRIEARPRWRGRDIAQQVEFARWLRANLAPVVDTAAMTPAGAADTVAEWVLHLRKTASPRGGWCLRSGRDRDARLA